MKSGDLYRAKKDAVSIGFYPETATKYLRLKKYIGEDIWMIDSWIVGGKRPGFNGDKIKNYRAKGDWIYQNFYKVPK